MSGSGSSVSFLPMLTGSIGGKSMLPALGNTNNGFGNTKHLANTKVTSINPLLQGAETVRPLVGKSRKKFNRTLSVNQRRSMHPLEKQVGWSMMELPKPTWKSLTRGKK